MPFVRFIPFIFMILSAVMSFPVHAEKNIYLHEEVVYFPYDWGWDLEATVFKPDGLGPFPLVIINHGKSDLPARQHSRYRALSASREFVNKGYAVVLPMRVGFSKSDGTFSQSGCNLIQDGYKQAKSIQATLDHFVKQPYVDPQNILIVGFSYGGFVSVAYGASNTQPGVKGIINFSGGLKKLSGSCVWDVSLAKAFSEFGQKSKVPVLWFYTENDELFPPYLTHNLVAAYKGAGGNVQEISLGSFKQDGHNIFNDPDGIQYWLPQLNKFLKQINFPQ